MVLRLACFILFLAFPVSATVYYDVSVTDPAHHLARVTLTQQKPAGTMVLQLPTWRTGRYQILNQADNLRQLSATLDGKAVVLSKVDKSRWQLASKVAGKLVVTYQIYGNALAERLLHIDDSHLFMDASGALMYSPDSRQQPVEVRLQLPSNWRAYSGMQAVAENHFRAANYDVLVDSPIEAGINSAYDFQVDGRHYQLVIWGAGNYDGQQMARDLEKMVVASQAIWQGYPFKRYVFMLHATSGVRGATEHLNSTIIQLSRYSFAQREGYLQFLAIAAHEFVHTWNVKAYRPKGLVPYNYQQENYSDLLWLAEGSTSYLENQLLLRAGLISTEEFFTQLGKAITAFKHNPGRFSQSLAQASWDNWIAQGGDYAHNFSVNIYAEGELVSWLLDADLLKSTQNRVSYRDLHQRLYQAHRLPASFTDATVLAELKALSGKDYQGFWRRWVASAPGDIDFTALLNTFGLTLEAEDSTVYAGMQVDTDGTVLSVDKNSPAWQAGISDGDQLVALAGLKLTAGSLEARLKDFTAGDTLAVTFFRRDQLTTVKLTLTQRPQAYKVVVQKASSAEQKAAFKAWLGVAFPN